MALDTAHHTLERKSGADLRKRLRAKLVFANLTSTAFSGTPAAGEAVELAFPDEPAALKVATAATVTRDPSWIASTALGSELKKLDIIRSTNAVKFLPYADIMSSPFDQIEAANDQLARSISLSIDDDLVKAFIAGTVAASKHVTGKATDYITPAGVAIADGADLVIDAFINAAKWMLTNNLFRTGEKDYQLWAACPGALWGIWLDYIKTDKPSDSLFNLFIGPGSRNIGEEDRQNGIKVVLTNLIPTVEVTEKTHAQIIFGTNQAMVFAAAPTLMSSTPANMNTSGKIGTSYGQAVWWGRTVLNPEMLRISQIRQEA